MEKYLKPLTLTIGVESNMRKFSNSSVSDITTEEDVIPIKDSEIVSNVELPELYGPVFVRKTNS